MTTLGKTLTVLAVILAIGVGLVVWKNRIGGTRHDDENLNKISKEDMQLLLKDVNPLMLKRLSEDPDAKKKYTESLQQFLAVSNEARAEGLANDPKIKPFLEFIRAQVIASSYDREKNKDKGAALPPFSFIKKEEVDAFYQNPDNEAGFNELYKALIAQGKEENPDAPEPSAEQIQQLKEQYAKVKIYETEAEEAKLGDEFDRKVALQVKLQQAALLNQVFAQKTLKDKVAVTDEEVQQYIAAHPEFDPKAKKAKAEEILQRAKSGEDFAKLANEYSEDPGNKDFKTGAPQGGLYKDVKKGQMMPEFEQAALALEPGQIADAPVETKYGYHIIKLERKGATKDKDGKEQDTYDVRHILISTLFKDPENPLGQPIPVTDKIKADLEEEKAKKVLDEIKAKNPVEVEDFEVPKPSDEQMQQLQQQMMQQQMPPGVSAPPSGDEDAAPPVREPRKAAPKR